MAVWWCAHEVTGQEQVCSATGETTLAFRSANQITVVVPSGKSKVMCDYRLITASLWLHRISFTRST